MAQVKHHKFVAELPAELEADAIYYVRAGAGFDHYVTNSSGTIVAYKANAPATGADYAILYPNGGSEASPASVAINSRYVLGNPWPGHPVICVAEILLNGVWFEPGWSNAGNNHAGVRASVANGSVIVQTAEKHLTAPPGLSGAGYILTPSYQTSAPCRVKVWRIV